MSDEGPSVEALARDPVAFLRWTDGEDWQPSPAQAKAIEAMMRLLKAGCRAVHGGRDGSVRWVNDASEVCLER